MTITLNTETSCSGLILTFQDGRSAGMVRYTFARKRPWQFQEPPTQDNSGAYGLQRKTMNAAQYDGLAWAEDHEAA